MSVYELQSDNYQKINELKNIISINIYDMINPKNIRAYSGVIGLIVFCENGETLNYNENDKEFVYFFETVRRIYENEKNTRHIFIDEQTEFFLDSLNPLTEIKNIKSQIGLIGTSYKKIFYKTKELETEYNVLKYILENLMEFLGRNIDLTQMSGVGSNFSFKMLEDGIIKKLYFKYISHSELKSTLIFRDIMNDFNEFYIHIDYTNGLEIKFNDSNNTLLGIHKIDKKSHSLITEMYIEGECKLKKYTKLEAIDTEVYSEYLSEEENNFKKFILPWKDIILIHESVEESETLLKQRQNIELTTEGVKVLKVSDETLKFEKSEEKFIYISERPNHIKIIRWCEVTKTEYSPSLYKLSKISLKTQVETSITNYYIVNEKFLVKETSYIPSLLGSGIYKSELEGRSFYQIIDLINDKEYNIVKESVQGYQLLDENELKLVLGRGVK